MTGFVVHGHKYLDLDIRCRKHYILFLKMWMGLKKSRKYGVFCHF